MFRERHFELIVHCAAQPSHDKAREIPILDFEVNALGTVNLLEATRQPLSGSRVRLYEHHKVYGDAPPMKFPSQNLKRATTTFARKTSPAWMKPAASIGRCTRFRCFKAAADIVARNMALFQDERGRVSRRLPELGGTRGWSCTVFSLIW